MTTLLLLHGLAGTGSAWDALRDLVDQPVLAPDLPGHGRGDRQAAYDVLSVADALAASLSGPVAVLGHSWGGAVGTALAARADVSAVVAVGVKTHWPSEDVERFAALASRAPRVFATRDEALDRYALVSGVAPHPSGITEVDGGWALAMDPAAFAQDDPRLPDLVAAARCPVTLVRGEHDPMVSTADLAGCAAPVLELPGLGHLPHVEDPAALWAVVGPLLS